MLVRVYLRDLFVRQTLDPGCIIQDLRYDFARSSAFLELDDGQVAVSIDGQKVDELAMGRQDLPPDDHEVRIEQADIAIQNLLQLRLVTDGREMDLLYTVVDTPDTDLDGQSFPFFRRFLPTMIILLSGTPAP